MKSKTVWVDNFKSTITDDRGHEYIVDLPERAGGEDAGTSALEMCAMTFGGCISTIFAMVAKKMRLTFTKLEVDVDAIKGQDTITECTYKVIIESEEDFEKLEKCLEVTEKTCPVGVLYRKAGVEIKGELVKL
ncbi:MAG: OsmC family protein [Bacteroidales bacterium]|jgi:putative redox protein|nr:OsmC family protein [Bacteroidales bacterium]